MAASSSSSSPPNEDGDYCYDLRDMGIVSREIIDQGLCNCCWAIDAAELASSLYNSEHGPHKYLQAAAQELIDYVHVRIAHKEDPDNPKVPDEKKCLTSSTNKGFRYMMRFGLSMERDNKFRGQRTCKEKIPTAIEFEYHERIKKFPSFKVDKLSPRLWLKNLEKAKGKTEKEILKILSKQPIATAIKITPEFEMFTGNGIFDGSFVNEETKMEYERGQELRKKDGFAPKKKEGDRYHAVMIIGCGRKNGIKYYIIKNTWGTKWGDYGFARVRRDLCSIDHTSWPVGAELKEVLKQTRYGRSRQAQK